MVSEAHDGGDVAHSVLSRSTAELEDLLFRAYDATSGATDWLERGRAAQADVPA